MQGVENKVIVITGASSGIGEATAKILANNGAKVVLSARREERLQKLASTIGDNAIYLKSDVSNAEDMKALIALAKEKFGKVDVLFANAGTMPGGNMSELKVADWISMVDINVKGVLFSMAAVLPNLLLKEWTYYCNFFYCRNKISSRKCCLFGYKTLCPAMLDSFRTEAVMEGTNIRTTTIYPGAIKTELLNTIAPSETKTMVEEFYKNVGLEPSVIANAVLYAVSQPDNIDVSDLAIRPSKESLN